LVSVSIEPVKLVAEIGGAEEIFRASETGRGGGMRGQCELGEIRFLLLSISVLIDYSL
jgi:hypothetical protein